LFGRRFDSAQLHSENELLPTKTLIIKKIVGVFFCFCTIPLSGRWFPQVASGWMVQKDVDSLTNIHTPKYPQRYPDGMGTGDEEMFKI